MKEKVKAPFEHMNDRVELKKNYRDEEGNVILGPKNFLTNPPKEGKVGKNTTFSGVIKYMPEDYDAIKKLGQEEHKYHLSKLQDKPFS